MGATVNQGQLGIETEMLQSNMGGELNGINTWQCNQLKMNMI